MAPKRVRGLLHKAFCNSFWFTFKLTNSSENLVDAHRTAYDLSSQNEIKNLAHQALSSIEKGTLLAGTNAVERTFVSDGSSEIAQEEAKAPNSGEANQLEQSAEISGGCKMGEAGEGRVCGTESATEAAEEVHLAVNPQFNRPPCKCTPWHERLQMLRGVAAAVAFDEGGSGAPSADAPPNLGPEYDGYIGARWLEGDGRGGARVSEISSSAGWVAGRLSRRAQESEGDAQWLAGLTREALGKEVGGPENGQGESRGRETLDYGYDSETETGGTEQRKNACGWNDFDGAHPIAHARHSWVTLPESKDLEYWSAREGAVSCGEPKAPKRSQVGSAKGSALFDAKRDAKGSIKNWTQSLASEWPSCSLAVPHPDGGDSHDPDWPRASGEVTWRAQEKPSRRRLTPRSGGRDSY